MQHVLDTLVAMLEAGGVWVGPILGLVACLESIVAIGVFVPATPLLVFVGAAIGAGLVHWDVLLWSAAGASLGSSLSYESGRLARQRGFDPARLPFGGAAARTIFHRYGAIAIIVSRLLGPPASVPFLAGCAGLSRVPFILASGAASMLWTLSMAGIGVLASALSAR